MKEIFLSLVFIFSLQQAIGQGAWTRPQGNLYVQFGFHNISNYNSLFNNEGNSIELERSMTDRTLQFYGEFGITDGLTFLTNIPYKIVQSNDAIDSNPTLESGTLSGLGNVEFGLRQKIISGSVNVTAQLNFKANTADYNEALGLRTDIDASSFLPSVSVGKSSETYYAQAFVGYAWHSNNYSQYVRWGLEAGLHFLEKHWAILYIDSYDSLGNGDRVDSENNLLTGLFLNDQEYGGIGLKFIVSLPKEIKLNLGVGGAFFGNLVPEQGAVSVGLAREF